MENLIVPISYSSKRMNCWPNGILQHVDTPHDVITNPQLEYLRYHGIKSNGYICLD